MIRVLEGSSGYDVAYRIDGNSILKGSGGYDVAYRIDGDRILQGSGGYDVAYRIDGNRILKGSGGYDVAYRIDEDRILKGSDGYDVAFRLDKEGPSGCLGMLLSFFGLIFLRLPIPGKICAIAGFVLSIVGTSASGAPGNAIFIAPIGFLLGGGIGALGNFVIPKMSKAGKIGTLAGAVLIAVFFGIIGGKSNFLQFAILGLIFGAVVGALIGSLVGFIMKQVNRKK
jgi:Ca2+-binding RTX toxin-like protein